MSGILGDQNLESLPWDDLIRMRLQNPTDARIAPYEHRAYAREQVTQNPLMAPVYGMLVPGYLAMKMLTGPGRGTPASMDQLKQGLLGTGEGFLAGIKGLLGS